MSEGEDHQETFASPTKEEEVYTLLFNECNINGSGWASVDKLVDTIQQMLPSSPKKGEEVYDSDESVKEAQYSLTVLRCMLENHSIQGEINETSYIHVIRNWVKSIRSNSASPNNSNRSIDRSYENEQENESHDGVATSLFQESFETTGGGSSNHELDHQQLVNTVSELQLDNKRLAERNQCLLQQIEGSEETLRQFQTEKVQLETKVKSQQQNMAQIESLKEEYDQITQRLIDEEKVNEGLRQKIHGLNQDIAEHQSEICDLQNHVTSYQNDKDELVQETRTIRQQLKQKEDELLMMEEERANFIERLEERDQETISLQYALTNTAEVIEELKSENSSLQTQIKQPISSTPFRPQAPSLLEELAESGIMSPVARGGGDTSVARGGGGDTSVLLDTDKRRDEGGDFEELSQKLAQSKVKFQQKAAKMKEGLSELIDTPLTSRVGGDRSRMTDSFMSNKENEEIFESKIRKLETAKKKDRQRAQKLSDEVTSLREENETLRERCNQLKDGVRNQGSHPVGVVPVSSDVHMLLTSSPPLPSHFDTSTSPVEKLDIATSPLPVEQATVSIQTEGQHLGVEENTQHTLTTCTTVEELPSSTEPLFTVSQYNQLQEEVNTLRGQLNERILLDESDKEGASSYDQPIEDDDMIHVVDVGMTSAQEESRLESILQQRRKAPPHLEKTDIVEESFAPTPSSSSCLSSLFSFIYSVVKGSVWVLLMLLVILILVVVFVNFNSSLGRCSGRYCHHSPLHMLIEQNLQYSHTGKVPL